MHSNLPPRRYEGIAMTSTSRADWEWITVDKRSTARQTHTEYLKTPSKIRREAIRVSKPLYGTDRKHHAYLDLTNISLCGREIPPADREYHYLSLVPIDCERCRASVDKLNLKGRLP